MINVNAYLALTTMVFLIGAMGLLLNGRNIIKLFLCIELMLLAVSINFVAAAVHYGHIGGQVFTLVMLAIAAAEASVGLAILLLYYKKHKSTSLTEGAEMKG